MSDGKHNHRLRYGYLLIAVSFACVAALLFVFRYQPGLQPAPGYEMTELTQPGNAVAGFVKSVQSFVDYKPCDYTLLGWSDENTLYYEAECKHTLETWEFNTGIDAEPQRTDAVPSTLFLDGLAREDALNTVFAEGVRPASAEPPTRELYLSEQIVSPDGRWLAIVAERVYGPEDVLLLALDG